MTSPLLWAGSENYIRGRSLPLLPPPTDANGRVIPHDHGGILAADRVIRRISPQHIVQKPEGRRLSSLAFQPASENAGLSVDLEAQVIEAGQNPLVYVAQPPFIGSVAFHVAQVRAAGFQVGFNPLPDLPFHGEIWGIVTRGHKKAIQGLAQWHRPLPDVELA